MRALTIRRPVRNVLGRFDMTHLRPSKQRLTPMLRICAAMSLVFWLAALAFCSAECLDKSSDSDQMTQSAAGADHHDSDSDHHDHDDSFCVSLHSFAPGSVVCELAKPDFSLAFAPNFFSAPQRISIVEPENPIFRQPPNREWLFTSEVYLGPAFRSHAPPFSSLT